MGQRVQENFIQQNNKVSVCFTTLDSSGESEIQHLAGINKLKVSENREILATAGRDGNVRTFSTNDTEQKLSFRKIVSRHNSWVNDLQIIQNTDNRIVSVGNDCCVYLHDNNLYQHNDYIKCITSLPTSPQIIYTAGLDCCIKSYDTKQQPVTAAQILNTNESIYAIQGFGNLLAYGTTGSVLEVVDVREWKSKVFGQKLNNNRHWF